jgi:hypothetical protein
VSSVCHSVCPHRRTYPNLFDLYIKLKVFLSGTRKWWCKFCPENQKANKTGFWGIFFTFSHTNELLTPDLEICRDDLWTQSEKVLDTSVVILRPVLASPMLSYAEQGQWMDGWLEPYIGNKGRTGSSLDFKSLHESKIEKSNQE